MAMSPMMQEYCKTKEQYKDCILFYRLGDFYEMFFDDALLVTRELEITLTGKDCGLEERAPMCGVPYHAVDVYLNKLVAKGYKVAICEQAEDPKQAVAAQLPALEAAANAELQRQGSEDLARVSFRRELFPTREYDTFSLPAGVYDSLRVTIGQGEGHNWWCVIFPSLCVPATADGFAEAAAAGGFSTGEIRLLTQADPAYTVKFRSLELLQALKSRLFGEE